MSGECDHNAIHCDCGHQQDIEEAVSVERKRIIAKLRERARGLEYEPHQLTVADELEAECE